MKHLAHLFIPALSLAIIGCGSAADPREEQPAVERRIALKAFESCEDLRGYIEKTAIRQMQTHIDNRLADELRWLDDDYRGMPGADAGMAAAPQATPTTPGTDGPAAHTETNTQVKGVDEPDFIKNDGKRIFVLSGEHLYTARSWPPQALETAGKIRIEGHPTAMFLVDDQIVVFSAADVPADRRCYGYYCHGNGATRVTVVDVSDLAAPRELRKLVLQGAYHSARRVGNAMRVVLRDQPRWPEGIDYWLRNRWDAPNHDEREWLTEGYQQLKRDNERLLRGRSLEQWMPKATYLAADGSKKTLAYRCGDFLRPTGPTRLGVVSVVSVDLGDLQAQPHQLSVIAQPGTIYASKSSLYVSSPHWWWWDDGKDHTYLHKFDISDVKAARYVASGTVEGTLLNQFAMDEHEGYLRLATTITTDEEDPEMSWRNMTTNRVSVMRERAGQLELTGQTKDLADGERIFSVRFMGDKGYVVTFRQVDPLYTLDLSSPSNPKVIGELKVPGFSTYIHPLGDDHLLTIGVATDENGGWRGRRMKLTIFDVSDFASPKEKFTEEIGTAYGWTEAAYEHKAFNFFAERGLLAVPFSDYTWDYASRDGYWDSFVSELRVFAIDANKGITKRGALSFKDLYFERQELSWSYYYSPWVRRSVMAVDNDGIDYVYAVADVGIRVAKLSSLSVPLKTALFK